MLHIAMLHRFRFYLLLCIFTLFLGPLHGQTRSTIIEQGAYNQLPRRALSSDRAYESLPRSVSLKLYAPLPGDQDDFGTCVGWASAYAARTIAESISLNRRNQTETTGRVFSPNHIYLNIAPEDTQGRGGATIFSALDWMRDEGAVRMLDIERRVSFPGLDLELFQDSQLYPIAGYVTLFENNPDNKGPLMVRTVKMSLSEGKPVIIGMNTPDSFLSAQLVWEPRESPNLFYGAHAMCVVGYDDDRHGGAFEVMNSWGRTWGNGGFMWIPYDAFINFTLEAYELILEN